jgi:dTDP-4-amino-4,6-dideoxygalactose transaminase
MIRIPYHRPTMGDAGLTTSESSRQRKLAGDGSFTKRCHALLESRTGAARALLTHSGTAALELAALLAELKPGDEVIMPSYTFVSTANAVIRTGARPAFVDIRPDTLNIDESLIEQAVTRRTPAVVPCTTPEWAARWTRFSRSRSSRASGH